MNSQDPWLTSCLEELHALKQHHEEGGLDTLSAYRVLVLRARLDQARAAGVDIALPEPLRLLAEQVEGVAEQPDPHLLLGRLHALLPRDDDSRVEDPFGELLDTLLDVDDAASVEDSRRHPEAARWLVGLANGCVVLAADRVAELGDMAERRLELLPRTASIWPLWDTIARAAAEAVADALPPVELPPTSLSQRRLLERLQGAQGPSLQEDLSEGSLLAQTFQKAAADSSILLEESEHGPVGLYLSGDEVHLMVALPTGTQAAGDVELRVRVGERSTVWRFPIHTSSRRAVIASLGTRDALRERLRAHGLSASMGPIGLRVVLTLKEASDERG